MEDDMRSIKLLPISALLFLSATTHAAATSEVKLWRLDCGVIQENDLNLYSDTYAYVGQSKQLTAGCYLIQHGDTYMLWDTGLSTDAIKRPLQGPGATGESLSASLLDQLIKLDVDPKLIEIVGISHYHFDHTGQAAMFPHARLLMGKADVAALRAPGSARAQPLTHWLGGGGKLEEVTGDKDVFGDGTVIMLDLPGHTPGHHALLVKLAKKGYVLLSGDVAHFQENYETDGVPSFNVDRAQSLASLDRFKAIAKNLKATVIIQHEQADIAKLPAFPAYAE